MRGEDMLEGETLAVEKRWKDRGGNSKERIHRSRGCIAHDVNQLVPTTALIRQMRDAHLEVKCAYFGQSAGNYCGREIIPQPTVTLHMVRLPSHCQQSNPKGYTLFEAISTR
jgi:hypothetical protein